MNFELQSIVKKYPCLHRSLITEFLELLISNNEVKGVYVGGALTFDKIDVLSDIDIHCVIDDLRQETFIEFIDSFVAAKGEEILYVVKNRSFPWFGNLVSIYFGTPKMFYFDIGYIGVSEVKNFYFQYKGALLKDDNRLLSNRIASCRRLEKQKVEVLLQESKAVIVSSLVKLRKDILRKKYWDGFENINMLRRSYLFCFCYENYYKEKFPFIGRVERDIEDHLSLQHLDELDATIPQKSLLSLKTIGLLLLKKVLQTNVIVQDIKYVNVLQMLFQLLDDVEV